MEILEGEECQTPTIFLKESYTVYEPNWDFQGDGARIWVWVQFHVACKKCKSQVFSNFNSKLLESLKACIKFLV